jgi:hypothetical protein
VTLNLGQVGHLALRLSQQLQHLTSTKMDDLFGSDDDQQSELNDTPSPTEVHGETNARVANDDESAALDDLFGSESESEAKPARKR